MNRRMVSLAVALVFLILCIAPVWASGHGHGEKRPMKKGILLVAFGSSYPEAQVAFDNIDKKVKAAFPDIPVHWAYTASIIREKMAKQGKEMDSVVTALAKMMEAGFTHVAVQSLHTIAGKEFHDLRRNAHAFTDMAGGFERILVGYPLLGTEADLVRVTEAMIANLPQSRKPEDAVVFMGHGTHHPANAFYAAMMYHFQQKDPHIFVGTVEGAPTIDKIKAMLAQKGIQKAYLMPFMSVAGDHASNDMAGDEPDSWKSVLSKAGIECQIVLKGTAEFDNIADIWVDHLKGVMAHFPAKK